MQSSIAGVRDAGNLTGCHSYVAQARRDGQEGVFGARDSFARAALPFTSFGWHSPEPL